jgi:hypothetical protein
LSPQFGSTIQELNAVERLLSKERFLTYVTHAGGDREKAFRLYVHNLRLSSSLFETIGGLEIAFRNSVHLTLTQAFRSDNWFDNVPFTWLPHERGAIQKAKELIRSRKKQVLPGRIIAELTFGFWCGITGRAYRDLLWIPHLHKAFPFKRLGHKEAHNRLNEIRELRNRIAHHECVLHLDPARKYSNIVETVNWICPTTGSWIETNSSFPSICQSPPA